MTTVAYAELVQALRELAAAALRFDRVERGLDGWHEDTFRDARNEYVRATQYAQAILARIDHE